MTTEPQRMNFHQFQTHLKQVFERVHADNRPVLVERNDETFRLEKQVPGNIRDDYDPERVQRALTASRGLFAGTDRERFLREIHEQRGQGSNRRD